MAAILGWREACLFGPFCWSSYRSKGWRPPCCPSLMETRSRCLRGASFSPFALPVLMRRKPPRFRSEGASRRILQKLVPLGVEATLRIKTVDRYGRTVAEVSDGQSNLSRAMVAAGKAFVHGSYIDG